MYIAKSEKIVADYEELLSMKSMAKEEIANNARNFANARGYDAEKANSFVEYVVGIEGSGISKKNEELLDILGKYVEVVEDAAADEKTDCNEEETGTEEENENVELGNQM